MSLGTPLRERIVCKGEKSDGHGTTKRLRGVNRLAGRLLGAALALLRPGPAVGYESTPRAGSFHNERQSTL